VNSRLQIKGKELLVKSKAVNPHQLSLQVQMAAPTVHRYVVQPERVQALDLQVFSQLVMRSLHLTEGQFLELKIGDLFEFITKEDIPGVEIIRMEP
jgi:hypothetical protein